MSTQIGVFITKEHKDVTKPQNIQDYILHSNYNTLKIYKKIQGSIAVTAGGTVNTVYTHGLGYHPAFLSYYRLKQTSQTWWMDQTALNSNISENDGYRCRTFVNPTQIQFQAQDGESKGASTVEYKGFLFIDPIHLVPAGITGNLLSSGIGFKVSKPGIDVTKAKAHELLISSKYEALKFHMEKQITLTFAVTDTAKETSFNHGLSYRPMFMAVITDHTDATKESIIPYGRVPQPIASGVGADKSVIRLGEVSAGGVAFSDTFKIIVFKNKLSDD